MVNFCFFLVYFLKISISKDDMGTCRFKFVMLTAKVLSKMMIPLSPKGLDFGSSYARTLFRQQLVVQKSQTTT